MRLRHRKLFAGFVAVLVGAVLLRALTSREPESGSREVTDPLARCPDSPNCVCSEYEDGPHYIEPISFKEESELVWVKLVKVIGDQPRTKIVEQTSDYLRVTSTTLICRFVDDLEFRLDAEHHRIHVRSASRVGYSDLGVNHRRVEHIRSLLND